MSYLEPAANYYATKRHWSRNLQPELHCDGRRGLSLCRNDVWDQDEFDSRRGKRRTIADLPLCKLCERIAGIEETS